MFTYYRRKLALMPFLFGSCGCALAADLPSMKSTPALPPIEAPPVWFGHVGFGSVFFAAGGTVISNGSLIPGGSVKIGNNYTATFEAGRFFTPNIAVALSAGWPPLAEISGTGSLSSAGYLGHATYGPLALTAQYHLPLGQFQPYIGAGLSYTIIFHSGDAFLTGVDARNAIGAVIQGGTDYMLNEHWGLFVDVKKFWLSSDVTATGFSSAPGVYIPSIAHVTLNPLVVSAGLTYRF